MKTTHNTLAPRLTLAAIIGVVAVLLVGVGVRAGVVAAVVVAVIAVVLLSVPAVLFVITERRRARSTAAAAAATQSVQHCNCCDKACLMAKVCAPGEEPTVVHGAEPTVVPERVS